MKKFLAITLSTAILFNINLQTINANTETIEINPQLGCYPAYTCGTSSSLPVNYTLYFSNPNRSLGIYLGSAAIGAAGFIPGVSAASFVASLGIGAHELINGYSSYRTYVRRNPSSSYKGQSQTVYYRDTNYRGATKTVYKSW